MKKLAFALTMMTLPFLALADGPGNSLSQATNEATCSGQILKNGFSKIETTGVSIKGNGLYTFKFSKRAIAVEINRSGASADITITKDGEYLSTAFGEIKNLGVDVKLEGEESVAVYCVGAPPAPPAPVQL